MDLNHNGHMGLQLGEARSVWQADHAAGMHEMLGTHILDELVMVPSLAGWGADFITTGHLRNVHWQVQGTALAASVPVAIPARHEKSQVPLLTQLCRILGVCAINLHKRACASEHPEKGIHPE